MGFETYLFKKKGGKKMRINRYLIYVMAAVFLGGLVVGCKHHTDAMSMAEKIFIKKIDKTAGKLDLNEDQKAKLEGLKAEVRKNFEEGQKENREAWMKIKEEAAKENPDIQKMTSLLQRMLRDETQRFNKGFDLLLGFQSNLNDVQKKKLTKMISKRVKKWD
jgi:rubrerythrin